MKSETWMKNVDVCKIEDWVLILGNSTEKTTNVADISDISEEAVLFDVDNFVVSS